jgi:hypothetical protein
VRGRLGPREADGLDDRVPAREARLAEALRAEGVEDLKSHREDASPARRRDGEGGETAIGAPDRRDVEDPARDAREVAPREEAAGGEDLPLERCGDLSGVEVLGAALREPRERAGEVREADAGAERAGPGRPDSSAGPVR